MQKVNTIKIALAIHLRNYKESSEIERFLNSDESKAVALGDTIANINITPSSAPSFFSSLYNFWFYVIKHHQNVVKIML